MSGHWEGGREGGRKGGKEKLRVEGGSVIGREEGGIEEE